MRNLDFWLLLQNWASAHARKQRARTDRAEPSGTPQSPPLSSASLMSRLGVSCRLSWHFGLVFFS